MMSDGEHTHKVRPGKVHFTSFVRYNTLIHAYNSADNCAFPKSYFYTFPKSYFYAFPSDIFMLFKKQNV